MKKIPQTKYIVKEFYNIIIVDCLTKRFIEFVQPYRGVRGGSIVYKNFKRIKCHHFKEIKNIIKPKRNNN